MTLVSSNNFLLYKNKKRLKRVVFYSKIESILLAATYSPLTSTIGTTKLNFRVRNENGCDLGVKPPTQKIQFQQRDYLI